jgi:TolA-binding protein
MKTAVLVATLSLALAAVAAPASGEPAPTPPADTARGQDLGLSRMDQIMIQAQETAEWMARHHSRLELRDMNRAIERMCDRLQDAERRMEMLGDDSTVRADKKTYGEVGAFGDHLGVVAKELSALHASLRKVAEPPVAPADAAPEADRDAYRGRHAALMEEMNRLQKHSDEFHAWVVAKPAPRGLDEISRDLDLARQELHAALQAMDRLSADAGLLRERLVEMDRVHARARAVLQALGDAQDRVATLASAS